MDRTRYRVVCTGVLRDGFDIETVRGNLASRFKLTGEQAAMLTAGSQTVVKRGLDHDNAERFCRSLERAGVACGMQTEEQSVAPANKAPVAEDRNDADAGVLVPPKTHPSVLFTPVNCPRLRERDGSLDTGREDTASIPYDEVVLAAIWALETPNGQLYRLLLFTAGQRRPFEAEDTAIGFRSFHGVASATAREGFRRLIGYFREQNAGLLIDEPTSVFLDGKLPPLLEEFPLAHVTALGTALIERGVIHGD